MWRKLVSCADFKAIMTPFSRLRVLGFFPEILRAQNSKYVIRQTKERNEERMGMLHCSSNI